MKRVQRKSEAVVFFFRLYLCAQPNVPLLICLHILSVFTLLAYCENLLAVLELPCQEKIRMT